MAAKESESLDADSEKRTADVEDAVEIPFNITVNSASEIMQ